MKHTIEVNDLQAWVNENPLVLYASASGKSGNKRLYATIRGSYEVHHKGVKVWEGIQPHQATKKYNKI